MGVHAVMTEVHRSEEDVAFQAAQFDVVSDRLRSLVFPIKFNMPNGTTIEGLGLTKRELLAAMAMQGILARGTTGEPESRATHAIQHADALLKELAK